MCVKTIKCDVFLFILLALIFHKNGDDFVKYILESVVFGNLSLYCKQNKV